MTDALAHSFESSLFFFGEEEEEDNGEEPVSDFERV